MKYDISLQSEALIEIQEAFAWYEEQKEGLGDELLEEIEACYEKLSFYPERYSYINSNYRRIKTDRFPYLLVYEFEGTDIIITSFRHIKRKP